MKLSTKLFIVSLTLVKLLFGQESGKLTIYSQPPGCWVRVDSVLVGKTPLDSLALPLGTHHITISSPETGLWFHEEKNFAVRIDSAGSQTVSVRFSRPVFLNTIPYGAMVFAESKPVGTTPLSLPYARFFRKRLVFEKNGYQPDTLLLASPRPVLIRLKKKPGFVEPQLPKFPDLAFGEKKSYKKYKFVLLATSVVSSWAAFYFKNVADDNFKKYRRTADPVLINRYWNKTRKFDRLSDVALGVSYTSLAGFIYFLIWK